jgi:kynureninase
MEEFLTEETQNLFIKIQNEFLRPVSDKGEALAYFCGNSLGLQPKGTKAAISEVLNDWAELAVDGHFTAGRRWYDYPTLLTPSLAKLCGAKETEVAAMGTLTGNLHLMLVSFFQPKGKRTKILMEAGAFPSDHYAVETQLKFHGLNPSENIIEVFPGEGEESLKTEDILKAIQENADELALVLFSGVHFLSGQAFDMKAITAAAHSIGAKAGFDLAHAIGNIRLELHQWNVDFAVWCSYKYLNGGPGSVAGIFVHERFASDNTLPRFGGWFGHDESRRFLLEKGFNPIPGARGWQLSNENILSLAAIRASLELFDFVNPDLLEIRRNFLNYKLQEVINQFPEMKTITPESRGAQISVKLLGGKEKALFAHLRDHGVVVDLREPNILRMAATPLYTTENEINKLEAALKTFFFKQ